MSHLQQARMVGMLRFAPLLLLTGCIPSYGPNPVPSQPPSAAPVTPPPTVVPIAPAPPPVWQARPVVPHAVEVASSIYTVTAGDNLRLIARKTGAGSEAIARENGLRPPFIIFPGQKLRIPGGRYHRVGKGESGIAIARAYGVEWSRVAGINQLSEPYILRDGQRLLLPSATEMATMTLEQRAAAFRIDISDIITGGEPALAANARAAPSSPSTTAKTYPVRFGWPITGPIVRRFGSLGKGQRNDGINIGAATGTPILAAADGTVAYAGNEVAAFGGLILIRHAKGWLTAYGHAEQLLVSRGQVVKRGQVIARAGATGSVAEPQLHFEIREGRKPVNPMQYLPKRT